MNSNHNRKPLQLSLLSTAVITASLSASARPPLNFDFGACTSSKVAKPADKAARMRLTFSATGTVDLDGSIRHQTYALVEILDANGKEVTNPWTVLYNFNGDSKSPGIALYTTSTSSSHRYGDLSGVNPELMNQKQIGVLDPSTGSLSQYFGNDPIQIECLFTQQP